MTQLEKAREEIAVLSNWTNARKIVFENRVAIHCEKCNSTGIIRRDMDVSTICPYCTMPFPFNRP